MNARTQREDLEQLAREIAATENVGISLARLLAARQWKYLLGFAVDWDSMAAAQQREVHQGNNITLIGEQHAG